MLQRQSPQFVVVQKKPYPAIPAWLQEWIDRDYVQLDERFGYVILKKSNTP